MSLDDTPRSARIHIGFFGRRNAGKSSVVNAVTGQALSVVSDVKGTTTDPVWKAMELLPLGPVSIIDTPGYDDEGSLGELRMAKTREVLEKTDIAVLVVDATVGLCAEDLTLLQMFKERKLPTLTVYNKCELLAAPADEMGVSATTGQGIEALKEKLSTLLSTDGDKRRLVGDLLHPSDLVVLVTPIDSAAPKGRMILPQNQMIRDVLDSNAIAIVLQEVELARALPLLGKKPTMVITDSQVFARVSADTPLDIPLTSFSILMARYKGLLDTAVHGVAAINQLQDGDRILISEGCTHHRQCDDIGSVKLPRWLREYTGKALEFEVSAGASFPEDLRPYRMVIHCGACMLTARTVRYRMQCAQAQGVCITNYGIAIAYMQGILKRSLSLFPDLYGLLSLEDPAKGRITSHDP